MEINFTYFYTLKNSKSIKVKIIIFFKKMQVYCMFVLHYKNKVIYINRFKRYNDYNNHIFPRNAV